VVQADTHRTTPIKTIRRTCAHHLGTVFQQYHMAVSFGVFDALTSAASSRSRGSFAWVIVRGFPGDHGWPGQHPWALASGSPLALMGRTSGSHHDYLGSKTSCWHGDAGRSSIRHGW
jgi:hypothetical protein